MTKKAAKSRSQIETKRKRNTKRALSRSQRDNQKGKEAGSQVSDPTGPQGSEKARRVTETAPPANHKTPKGQRRASRVDGAGLLAPTDSRIVDASKKEAIDLSNEVQEGVNALERKWWHIGRLVDVCLKRHVPRALGLTAKQWMEKYLEGSLSDAFRKMRVIRSLEGVPEEKLHAMKQANAQQLCRLPEAERKSEEWVELAASAPIGEFKEKVEKRLDERHIPRENFGEFHLEAPAGIIEQMEAAEKKVAAMLGLNTFVETGWRIQAWEAIASMVNNTAEEHLKIEIEGVA